MNYRIAAARSRQQGNNRTRIIEAPIVHRCGHEMLYRSTEYGWAIVAGMSADVDCESCSETHRIWCETEGAKLAGEFTVRQQDFEAAVARRDGRMAALGVSNVYDSRISVEQNEVWRTDARLGESKRARYLLGLSPHAC